VLAVEVGGTQYRQRRRGGPGAVASNADDGALGDVAGGDQATFPAVSISTCSDRSGAAAGERGRDGSKHLVSTKAVVDEMLVAISLSPFCSSVSRSRWGYSRIRGELLTLPGHDDGCV
jgi:hypothetical protein